MDFIKSLVKKIAFAFFPHIKYYNERISNLELAITTLASSPDYNSDYDSLNRQLKRKEIVADVLSKLKPFVIVETGTHTGNSTGYFAKNAEIVYTSDSSPIYMWAAKNRLKKFPNINFFIGDSRTFLENIQTEQNLKSKTTFFYLDAHWHEDLPLAEEISIIATNWQAGNWVILIDDFCVPDDDGYAYPSYGPDKTLNYEYIRNLVERENLKVFYPTIPSKDETGFKTGYVFLANEGAALNILKSTVNLKQF